MRAALVGPVSTMSPAASSVRSTSSPPAALCKCSALKCSLKQETYASAAVVAGNVSRQAVMTSRSKHGSDESSSSGGVVGWGDGGGAGGEFLSGEVGEGFWSGIMSGEAGAGEGKLEGGAGGGSNGGRQGGGR